MFTLGHFRALVLSRGSLLRFSIGSKQWRKANPWNKGELRDDRLADLRDISRIGGAIVVGIFLFSIAGYAVDYRAAASRRHRLVTSPGRLEVRGRRDATTS